MSIWVCPHCPKPSAEKKIEQIEGLARLYAYPCKPEFANGGLVILDSGAFGLHQAGKKMNFAYMKRLSEHYEKYYADNVFCVAPDVSVNPMQSMQNFKRWHKNGFFKHIVPVLHSDKIDSFHMDTMLYQANFYRKYSDVVFIGSPKLSAELAKQVRISDLFKELKLMGYRWLHKLGVGWNLEEVKVWRDMPYLDSFDSIAYYSTRDINGFGSLDAFQNVEKILEVMQNGK